MKSFVAITLIMSGLANADVLDCHYEKTNEPFARVTLYPGDTAEYRGLNKAQVRYAKAVHEALMYYTTSQREIINWSGDYVETTMNFRPGLFSLDAFALRKVCSKNDFSCSYYGKDYDSESSSKSLDCQKVVPGADVISNPARQSPQTSDDRRIECGEDFSCPSGYKCKVEWRPGPFYCERR